MAVQGRQRILTWYHVRLVVVVLTPSRFHSPTHGNFHLLFILHSLLRPLRATPAGGYNREIFAAQFSVKQKVADDLVADQ